MKSILTLKNSLININKSTFPKLGGYLHCKNFSFFQRQTASLNFYANQITYTFTENNSQNLKFTLNQIEDNHRNNTEIDPDEMPSDFIKDKIDNTEDKLNIQIELKGRNSKSPKRVKYIT